MNHNELTVEMTKVLTDCYVRLNELRVKHPEYAHYLYQPTNLIEKAMKPLLFPPMIVHEGKLGYLGDINGPGLDPDVP